MPVYKLIMPINANHGYQKLNGLDESEFCYMFEKYYRPLCFFCNIFLKDLDISRSVVQQVFVEIWIKKNKLNINTSIKTYLYTSVKNKAIDYIRTQKPKLEISAALHEIPETPFQDLMAEAELKERINMAIDMLPEKCREIFVLCRYEELKYKQVADKLNISLKTVEMQMGIALKKLRKNLTDYKHINLFALFFSKKS